MSDKYPNNIDAERAVLGSILLNPLESIAVVCEMFPSNFQGVFYDKNLQSVYDAMVHLYLIGEPVDGISVSNKMLNDGVGEDIASVMYLSDIENSVPTSANVQHYAGLVLNCYSRRRVMESSKSTYNSASNLSVHIDDVIDHAKSSIQSIAPCEVGDEYVEDGEDPGPVPLELLNIPGFVSDVAKHTLASSHYPNPAMAYAGAMSLLSMLISRKVTDERDTRANLYILGLAPSASGKNDPRRTNSAIMNRVYQESGDFKAKDSIINKVGSAEGIEDHLTDCPSSLWQCDEVAHLISALANGGDTNARKITESLLQLFTDSSNTYNCRKLAKSKDRDNTPRTIESPCLSFFGTGIPQYFYESLSEQMLTDGFFSRMVVIESSTPRVANEPSVKTSDVPQNIVDTAMYWWSRDNGLHNMGVSSDRPPSLLTVKCGREATSMLRVVRNVFDKAYRRHDEDNDALGTSIWGRAYQLTLKFALAYANSVSPMNPEITVQGIEMASRFIDHQSRRMIYKAREKSFGSDHEKDLKKVFGIIKGCKGFFIKRDRLSRKMRHLSSKQLDDVVDSMVDSGMVKKGEASVKGRGRPASILTLIKQED